MVASPQASTQPTSPSTSTTEEWEALWDLFHTLLDLPPAERESRLADLSPSVADEVRGLLAAHRSSGDFLPSPWKTPSSPSEQPHTDDPLLGQQVGPYQLRQVLGQGGMGIVFLAHQEQPVRRRVALKVLQLGLASHHVLARFEAERQALVMMGHPNVATAFDTGSTEDGRPYVAMEYVAGLPIDIYCDRLRLPVHQRLRLMVDVCRGVAHAHLRGVVHRDLKPSNILVAVVDGEAVPKVIDFGIAKAVGAPLTERPAVTELGSLIGTPEYMSPEQADRGGLDVGTASDIYSLGTLIYRLLAGALPFDSETLRSGGFGNLCRILVERPPDPASRRFRNLEIQAQQWIAACRQTTPDALVKQLEGSLDSIVLRCLEKDPTRRPSTVQSLGAAIESCLGDEATAPQGSSRRRSGPVGLLVVLACLAALALWWGRDPSPPSADVSTSPVAVPLDVATSSPQRPATSETIDASEEASAEDGASDGTESNPDLADTSTLPAVALTFDDVPSMTDGLGPSEMETLNAVLRSTLQEHAVPATLFVTGKDLQSTSGRVLRRRLVADWVQAGFNLGNHTLSHPSYHRMAEPAYFDEIRRTDELLRQILPTDRPPRFFRHPFLHTGRDLAHRQALEGLLKQMGYRVAPVTVENQDWLFETAHRRTVQESDAATRQRVVDAYVDFNGEALEFAERLVDTLTTDPIPHVLLLHATALNAEALPRLLELLRQRGYHFITLDEALAHPIYERGADDEGIEGLIWPVRWVVASGHPVPWHLEPEAPEWIQRLAESP